MVFSRIRLVLMGLLVVALGMFGSAGAAGGTEQSGVDLAVGLHATGSVVFIAGARYTVSLTNNGPQALVGATVVVQLDPHVAGTPPAFPSCPYDAATHTLTCSFGALAAGATTSLAGTIYFTFPTVEADFDATATLASSTPADSNAANNTATAHCHYTWRPGIPIQPWPPLTFC
jgi:hypothetical protein